MLNASVRVAFSRSHFESSNFFASILVPLIFKKDQNKTIPIIEISIVNESHTVDKITSQASTSNVTIPSAQNLNSEM